MNGLNFETQMQDKATLLKKVYAKSLPFLDKQ